MKQTIITILFTLVAVAGQAQETTGRVMLTDSIAIRADSLCQRNDICNHDTIRKIYRYADNGNYRLPHKQIS